jgi:hypothetical protein
MDLQVKEQTVDLVVVTLANLMNIIMVFIFYLRTKGVQHSLVYGVTWGVFILILAGAVLFNIRAKRELWFIVLPILLALFLLVELVLDYIMQIEFRSTSLLGPYLLLYYVSIMGMIGYAFLTGKKLGVLTLITYFASQIAALFSYIRVGHG